MTTQSRTATAYQPAFQAAGLPGVDYDIDRAWQKRLGQALVRFLVRSLELNGQHPIQW
jgi:hypothetical protein